MDKLVPNAKLSSNVLEICDYDYNMHLTCLLAQFWYVDLGKSLDFKISLLWSTVIYSVEYLICNPTTSGLSQLSGVTVSDAKQ